MIALKYINKNAATVAAIRDYESMRFIINNTPQEIKDVYVQMTTPRESMLSGMPFVINPQSGADKLAAQIDKLDILRERYSQAYDLDFIKVPRSNSKITSFMAEEVWRSFLRHLEGTGEISSLSKEVSNKTGMNRGSVFIYLNILSNLVKGVPNTRTMKMNDLEYYMGKIQKELGESKYRDALTITELVDSLQEARIKMREF